MLQSGKFFAEKILTCVFFRALVKVNYYSIVIECGPPTILQIIGGVEACVNGLVDIGGAHAVAYANHI